MAESTTLSDKPITEVTLSSSPKTTTTIQHFYIGQILSQKRLFSSCEDESNLATGGRVKSSRACENLYKTWLIFSRETSHGTFQEPQQKHTGGHGFHGITYTHT